MTARLGLTLFSVFIALPSSGCSGSDSHDYKIEERCHTQCERDCGGPSCTTCEENGSANDECRAEALEYIECMEPLSKTELQVCDGHYVAACREAFIALDTCVWPSDM